MQCCPLCRLPRKDIGRLIAFEDSASKSFVFAICAPCGQRLDRLPARQQFKLGAIAVSNLERHPGRYYLKSFETVVEARLFVSLEAERLRSADK